ncbi:hypothetical protein VW35_10640 [Devosia soli]|uniref:Uncharacterized protein n=1 Tax=Devosia soli TaxID=361041 RepID=A0A0F5L9H6_9HYPH|nr:hypothetical protein [Devosia soli]KKB78920.1 hypothetical protein VW35_10640 [Devosia soli]
MPIDFGRQGARGTTLTFQKLLRRRLVISHKAEYCREETKMGKLTVITGLAIEAWLLVAITVAGVQALAMVVLG